MRTVKKVQRVLFSCAFVLFTLWYLFGFETSLNEYTIVKKESRNFNETEKHQNPNLKYILQWHKPTKEPYTFMKTGQEIFFERQCPVNNCYVTSDKTYLSNINLYDAILFYSHQVNLGPLRITKKRSIHQKYVFVSTESAAYNPVDHLKFDDYFNLTWTYKLNSDVYYGYILIRDKNGNIKGPKKVMHWPSVEEMKPINNELREKLNGKKVAAAWLASNCRTQGGRENIARQLQLELAKFNLTLDIYGRCGNKSTPPQLSFWQVLERDYYFYLSFENSLSEDYVTEKLLNAVQHYTVPIVYGGANYTRFMPDGTYLNVRKFTLEELVRQMIHLINHKQKYYDYFKWNNHYTYYYAGDTPDTDYYCNFCKIINNEDIMNRTTIYKHFGRWWNEG